MRLEQLTRGRSSALVHLLVSNAWRLGLPLVIGALLLTRGATQAPIQLQQRPLQASSSGPTIVPCGSLPPGTTTWTAAGSPYILPLNTVNDPTKAAGDCPSFSDPPGATPPGVVVAAGSTLVIDATQGPVQIFSHGAGLNLVGGSLQTVGAGQVLTNNAVTGNFISFDAEPDVAAWDGIAIHADGSGNRGNASLAYTSIQHALTAISIDSGSTDLSDGSGNKFGLMLDNVGIGPSYFDGVDATNTAMQFLGAADGRFGTVNNIGAQGLNITFDPSLANYPAQLPSRPLDVEKVVFGSSVPFAETSCAPLQPCAAGTIGNDAIDGNFTGQRGVLIDGNKFFRAGSFGIDLENSNRPQVTNNDFVCNGSGSPTPVTSCTPSGLLPRFSAIYLNNVTADLQSGTGVTNNVGQQNGLDALVISGDVTSNVVWKTPTNDPSATNAPHPLGYMVANLAGNGGLQLLGTTLTVQDGDVVKVKGGGITLTGGSLDASSSGLKSFTSMRDNGVGIQACPSVFTPSCLTTLPPNEWGGLDLVGASGVIKNANILFPTKGVVVSNQPPTVSGPDGQQYGLIVRSSRIGPTFSNSIEAQGVGAYVDNSSFCTIDSVALKPDGTANPTYGSCTGAGPGDHGVLADFAGTPGTPFTLLHNDLRGSTNEAIQGTNLGGRAVDIESNSIENAGASGMQLAGADNLTLRNNSVSASGTGDIKDAAIWLNGIANGDFNAKISGNTGSGNGINGIVFHGNTLNGSPLTWKAVQSSGDLGYVADGAVTVNGNLTIGVQAPVLNGAITVKGGTLTTTTGGRLTSVKAVFCGSFMAPLTSGSCQAPAPGDWGGLILDGSKANTLTGTDISYPATGIRIDNATGGTLSLSQTNIREVAVDAVHSDAPITVTGGQLFNTQASSGNGIWFDRGANVTGTAIDNTGQEGILGSNLNGTAVVISGASVNRAKSYGIRLTPAGGALDGTKLTLTNNVVSNSGAGTLPYAAIYLNGLSAGKVLMPNTPSVTPSIQGNTGNGNGIDALVFHGSVAANLSWITARQNHQGQVLGYLLDGDLDMAGNQLTVSAGDVVKVGNGGTIRLNGGQLLADDTSSSSQKVFTSLGDGSVGAIACPSVFLSSPCNTAATYWGGLSLSGTGANGAVVNANIRNAASGISIDSGATATDGSSTFGLTVARSTIASITGDALHTSNTSISVTNSTIASAGRGITADLSATTTPPSTLFLSGNRFQSTSAEAILGQALAGRPVWISDNHITGAATFGIRLDGADELVLRNNNVSHSGAGSTAYSAMLLTNVTGNFVSDIRGNVGQGDGINAIAMDGKVDGNLAWITPPSSATATTRPLGYMLDGGLTLEGGDLSVAPGDVVKGLGGPIALAGGAINVAGTSLKPAVFSSVKDQNGPYTSCPSYFGQCTAAAGDWGGLLISDDGNGQKKPGNIAHALINYPATGISIDSGPVSTAAPGLQVLNTTILNASKDGISAFDSPIDVESSYIGDGTAVGLTPGNPNIGAHGIIASFFSRSGCPPSSACSRLKLIGDHVAQTAKDGIVANGLGGQPVDLENNVVANAGAYGIRLVGADNLTLARNTVNGVGGPTTSFRYPAIYLNGVKADFEPSAPTTITTPLVAENHGSGNGMDALVFHGEATNPLTWLTTGLTFGTLPADHLGYMLDGALTVDGGMTANSADAVAVLNGAITVNGNLQVNGDPSKPPAVFTSLNDSSLAIKSCGSAFDSAFVQRPCPTAAAGDWGGLMVTGSASLTNAEISYDDGLTVTGGALSYVHGSMQQIKKNAIVASGHQVTITDLTFDHVQGTSIDLQNATADLERNVFTNDAAPAIQSTGAPTSVRCSSIQSGGVSGDGGLTVTQNDFTPGVGVTATPGATAENNWWGQSTGPANQVSGITVTNYLHTQNPTVSIATVGVPSTTQPLDNNNSNGAIGTGLVQATLTFSREMNTTEVNEPSVSYATTPVNFTDGWKANDPKTWIGTAPVDSTRAPNGTHTISASGAHDCVPDPAHNLMTPSTSTTFTADTTSLPALTVNAADKIGEASATLHAHIDPKGWATGSTSAGQFVLTNIANASDRHTFAATPALADKTTAIDVSGAATGLAAGTTYTVELDVPSVNGTATKLSATNLTTLTPAKLVLTSAPPASVAAGSPFSVSVQVQDGSGTPVLDDTSNVTAAIGTNPSLGTLLGTKTVAAVGGTATLTGLSIDKAGNGYTLVLTDGSLTSVTTGTFNVTAPTVTSLSSGPTTPYPTPPTVTITATISPTGASAPSVGTVAFTAGGASISAGCDAAAVTGGQATCVTDYSTVNGKDLAATYSGGTAGGVTYSSSASGTLTGTKIAVSHSSGTFTATVSYGVHAPTDGQVQFVVGGVLQDTEAVSAGVAQWTPNPALTSGTTVTEIYVPSNGSSLASSEATDTAP